MAKPKHFAKLKEGVEAWSKWRKESPKTHVDLRKADIGGADLRGADLSGADLTGADLGGANLTKANLRKADLRGAVLDEARLNEANLNQADLSRAHLIQTDLIHADLSEAILDAAALLQARLRGADLSGANLTKANLWGADLRGADLRKASLPGANLSGTDFTGANLLEADLSETMLIKTRLKDANLTGCQVFGISVWDVDLEGATQANLLITPFQKSAIQVDNLEVAQFIYLLLNNEKVRHVIDTITSKVVLILGRFTSERKAVLDAIRNELRKRDYVPILFDFEKPENKDLTGTVTTLASMARFVIADLTDPSSLPHELATIAPNTIVPIQAILLAGQKEYAMFADLQLRYHWVLKPFQYQSQQVLLERLSELVIAPAEAKVIELRQK